MTVCNFPIFTFYPSTQITFIRVFDPTVRFKKLSIRETFVIRQTEGEIEIVKIFVELYFKFSFSIKIFIGKKIVENRF